MKCFVLLLLSALPAFGQLTTQQMQPFFSGAGASSAQTPASFSGQQVWWVSSDTVVGNTIATWPDRIQTLQFTNGNAATRPTNSLRGMRFDGSSWVLTNNPPTQASGSAAVYWAIINPDAQAGSRGIISDFSPGRGFQSDATPQFQYGGVNIGQTAICPLRNATNTDILINLAALSNDYYTNGILAKSQVTTVMNAFAWKELGHSAAFGFWKGYIVECGIWTNRSADAAMIAALHRYATNTYSFGP